MKSVDCSIKYRSAHVASYFLNILQCCALWPITRFYWAYNCNGQSEAFRLVTAEMLEFCSVLSRHCSQSHNKLKNINGFVVCALESISKLNINRFFYLFIYLFIYFCSTEQSNKLYKHVWWFLNALDKAPEFCSVLRSSHSNPVSF